MMLDQERVPLAPGAAFELIRKLLALNAPASKRVEVVLLSMNSPEAGVRVMRSIREHGLQIEKAVFCGGSDRFRYA